MSCWCLRKAKGRGKCNKVLVWHAGWSSREGSCGRWRAGTNSSLPSCTKLCWRACLAAKVQILLYPGGQFAYSFLITGFPFTPGSSLTLWKTLLAWGVALVPMWPYHIHLSYPMLLSLRILSAGEDVSCGPALLHVYTHVVGGLCLSFDSSCRMTAGWVGVLW